MSIIKETIRATNLDANIKFTLSSNSRFFGQQQEIDTLTTNTSNDLLKYIYTAALV